MKTTRHLLLLTLFLFTLSWIGMSSLAFFKSDTGMRFWQIEELVENNWQTFAVDYPGHYLDPELEFIPLYFAYSIVDEQIFLRITPFFPLIGSLFYIAGPGVSGLALLAALTGAFTALGSYKLARLVNLSHPYLLLWSTVVATPLLFYTIQLWDHSLAVACAVWALYGTALGLVTGRWQPLAGAGFVAAMGMGQRPELYFLVAALGLALLLVAWRRWYLALPLATGGVIGMLPVWWLQYRWYGHPLGLMAAYVSDYARPPSTPYQFVGETDTVSTSRFLLYIGSRDIQSFAAALLVIAGLFLLIFWLRLPALRRPWIAVSALLTTVTGYALWSTLLWERALPGLLTTFPLVGPALTFVDKTDDINPRRPIYLLTLITGILFLAGMLAFGPEYGGDHFGARYLLPVYPLLLFLAFYTYDSYLASTGTLARLRLVAGTLLAVSVGLQLLGLRIFLSETSTNTRLQQNIAELPADVILTNHPFMPTMIRGLDNQFFLYVDAEADFDTLIPRFVAHDIWRFAVVPVEALPLRVPESVGQIAVRQVAPLVYEVDAPP